MRMPILYLIIPCYNEERVLPETAPMFLAELQKMIGEGKIAQESRILFVNDGSRDQTWEIIKKLASEDPHYQGIAQSRNRGHQNAVLAGLMEAKDLCDISISIDCDGQDDINAMEEMVDAYLEGYDVVYGVRSSRQTDTFFKRFTAQAFYGLLRHMGADVVYNHADYRLMSARVLQEFAQFKEVNLFLRGMVPLVGFRSTSVYYERHERIAGESHYPLKKMLALAFDGISSLSVKPIGLIIGCGIALSVIALLGLIGALITLAAGCAVRDLVWILLATGFFAGFQLQATGIIGIYVGKTYMETKARPRYIISERTDGMKRRLMSTEPEADRAEK